MAVRPDDEQSMPIDLRAAFSVRLFRRGEEPAEIRDAGAASASGVWWVKDVDIEGLPCTIVFSAGP